MPSKRAAATTATRAPTPPPPRARSPSKARSPTKRRQTTPQRARNALLQPCQLSEKGKLLAGVDTMAHADAHKVMVPRMIDTSQPPAADGTYLATEAAAAALGLAPKARLTKWEANKLAHRKDLFAPPPS